MKETDTVIRLVSNLNLFAQSNNFERKRIEELRFIFPIYFANFYAV